MSTAQPSRPASHDVAVLIGRFQPFHFGHLALLQQALDSAKSVVVVLGSANQARTVKNPFTTAEREAMISLALPAEQRARVTFAGVRDYYDNAHWFGAVRAAVKKAAPDARSVALVGHFKDSSSFYLKCFPGWTLLESSRCTDIDATAVRKVMFETPGQPRDAVFAVLKDLLPPAVLDYLSAWWALPHAAQLASDAAWLKTYRERWNAPFYNAADSVVVCSGHVLLIRRGKGVGRGLYAVPGGFMETGQQFYETAVRELREETNLGFLSDTLDSQLKATALFDHPGRSPRGRIVSMAYLFDLGNLRLPEVSGQDDAMAAEWVPIEKLAGMEAEFFEDHFHILDHFLKLTV